MKSSKKGVRDPPEGNVPGYDRWCFLHSKFLAFLWLEASGTWWILMVPGTWRKKSLQISLNFGPCAKDPQSSHKEKQINIKNHQKSPWSHPPFATEVSCGGRCWSSSQRWMWWAAENDRWKAYLQTRRARSVLGRPWVALKGAETCGNRPSGSDGITMEYDGIIGL